MYIIQVLIIILIVIGIFLIFDISVFKSVNASGSISFKKAQSKGKRVRINAETTLNRYEKTIIAVDALLAKIGKKRSYLYMFAAMFFITGVVIGYVCFNGAPLAICTGIMFVPLTYLYLLFRTQEKTREELAELQNAMSIITNSYLSNNNILKAVESYVEERSRYQEAGITQKVTPFEEFVSDCLYISANIDRNLAILAVKINNKYFDQWVKNLRLCMGNREMRFSLQPVIDAMVDEKIMQIESDTQLRKTWTNYIMVVAAMFATIFAFRLARKEWYLILTQTTFGQLIIFLMLIAALISAIYVKKINKPIGTI